jgi:hypothetical protein
MKDLQVFKAVDVIKGSVVADSLVEGVRTVELELKQLAAYVAEVIVNGYQSSSFAPTESHAIEVALPSLLNSYAVENLEFAILSNEYSNRADVHEVLYDIGRHSKVIGGNDYLIQRWIRFLLMSPGTDKKDKDAGVGLLQFAGAVTPANLSEVRTIIARMHHDCKAQILARQTPSTAKKPSETLRDARLLSVSLDQSSQLIVRSVLVDGNNRALNAEVGI